MTWTYILDGEISEGSSDAFLTSAYVAHVEDPTCDFEIVINSSGGDMEDGGAIHDALRAFSLRGNGTHFVTTTILGKAYSMGALIAQAGDIRRCGPMSLWMFHEPTSHLEDTIQNLKDDIQVTDSWLDTACEILCERSSLTEFQVRDNIHRRNWYCDAHELLMYRLVDEIVGNFS